MSSGTLFISKNSPKQKAERKMIQSLFILTTTGEVIIEKHSRTMTTRSVCDYFWEQANKYTNREDVPPIIHTTKHYLISVFRDGLFVLAVVAHEIPPLFVIEFLHRVVSVFRGYFGSFQESTIKDNFSTVYQLLEEMLDNGYPLTTEPNALKSMIAPPSTAGRLKAIVSGISGVSNELPDGTISNIPWRRTGVKYAQNEIYFDIMEEIDAIVDAAGQMVSFDVAGSIQAKSRLSGVPDLTLVLVDPSVIDDCSFHPCVRYSRYERDRVISFVPPDGEFELMRYRVKVNRVVPPIYCQPVITYDMDPVGTGTLEVAVGTRTMSTLISNSNKGPAPVEDMVVEIPFPKAVRTVDVDTNCGTCLFDESTKTVSWNIPKFGKKVMNPRLTGKITLQQNAKIPDEKPAINLHFKAPMTTVSGIAVDTLLIANEKYKPYKGIRTVSKSGHFQIRVWEVRSKT